MEESRFLFSSSFSTCVSLIRSLNFCFCVSVTLANAALSFSSLSNTLLAIDLFRDTYSMILSVSSSLAKVAAPDAPVHFGFASSLQRSKRAPLGLCPTISFKVMSDSKLVDPWLSLFP